MSVDYLAPADLDTALAAFADGSWTVLAGGTDFYPARVGRPLTEPVIDISGLDELRGITVTEDSYRIGALTRWADIREADLPRVFDGLRLAAGAGGWHPGPERRHDCRQSLQCLPRRRWDSSALDPRRFGGVGLQAGRRVIPLQAFLTGYRQTDRRPDELVTAVIVPRGVEEAFSDFQKLGSRSYLVISIVMVATVIEIAGDGTIDRRAHRGGSVFAGGAKAHPTRSPSYGV